MSLEIKFGKSRWWYGRVTVRGRVLCKNLGVEIEGNPPARLSEVGDIVFERSRSKAQAALERFQIEIRKRSAAEELVQTIHEIRTGERIRSIELKDILRSNTLNATCSTLGPTHAAPCPVSPIARA
ncbi:MAG: hypothetical protein WC205_06910 [Opitutaceae bacterium]|jgi:hypothetical protein